MRGHYAGLGATAAGVIIAFLAFRESYLLTALILAGIYTVAVLGLVLLSGLAGPFSLGHAAFFGLGAYTTAILAQRGLPPVVGLGMALALTGGIAALIGNPILRFQGYYLSMATLAFGQIVFSILIGWRALTGGASGIVAIPPFAIGPLVVKGEVASFALVWSAALIVLWLSVNLWHSRMSLALRAVRDDPEAAAASGINISLLKLQAFVLSAIYGALAGGLYAHYVSFISPERFSMFQSFELLLVALLGGIGSPFGAVIGALLLIGLPELLVNFQDLKVVVYGVIFLLVALYFPQGLVGFLQEGLAARVLRSRRVDATGSPQPVRLPASPDAEPGVH